MFNLEQGCPNSATFSSFKNVLLFFLLSQCWTLCKFTEALKAKKTNVTLKVKMWIHNLPVSWVRLKINKKDSRGVSASPVMNFISRHWVSLNGGHNVAKSPTLCPEIDWQPVQSEPHSSRQVLFGPLYTSRWHQSILNQIRPFVTRYFTSRWQYRVSRKRFNITRSNDFFFFPCCALFDQ